MRGAALQKRGSKICTCAKDFCLELLNVLHGPLWQRLVPDIIGLECQDCSMALR